MSNKDLYAFKRRRNSTQGAFMSSQHVKDKMVGHYVPRNERKIIAADEK